MSIISVEILPSAETSVKREYSDVESDISKGHSDINTTSPLTKDNGESDTKPDETTDHEQDSSKPRHDFMEYMTRNDGSVVCKLCGEILQSRTHWYRHKYKLHVMPPLNPAPLFQCDQCLVFFKSRKGYIGHLASRHSELLSDANPVLTNTQAEASAKEASQMRLMEEKPIPEPDHTITLEMLPDLTVTPCAIRQTIKAGIEVRKPFRSSRAPEGPEKPVEYDERRTREELMVASIIDRVRRECEEAQAQGSGGPARRGYTRRTTVMHT